MIWWPTVAMPMCAAVFLFVTFAATSKVYMVYCARDRASLNKTKVPYTCPRKCPSGRLARSRAKAGPVWTHPWNETSNNNVNKTFHNTVTSNINMKMFNHNQWTYDRDVRIQNGNVQKPPTKTILLILKGYTDIWEITSETKETIVLGYFAHYVFWILSSHKNDILW